MTKIWITTSFIGFHSWPEAPGEVRYLAVPHRHKFGVRVEVEPRYKADRVIEFHILQSQVNDYIREELLPLSDESCEEIAKLIADQIFNTNPLRNVLVSVDEDGECGATITVGEEH